MYLLYYIFMGCLSAFADFNDNSVMLLTSTVTLMSLIIFIFTTNAL